MRRSLNFFVFKSFVNGSVCWELQLTQISLNFKNSYFNWTIRGWEKKYERLFYYFNFERNNYVLKSKSPFISLNKNIYFNKNEKESKMENPTHRFRETNLESQIKSKSVMSWSSRRKKEGIFCNICFARRIVFKHLCYI